MLKPGSLVFTPPARHVDPRGSSQWWRFEFGANSGEPLGRGRKLRALDDHPVVHIAYQDAEAYAAWVGKQLRTEAEWEFAARSGLDGAEFARGDERTPGGRRMANTFFPAQNQFDDKSSPPPRGSSRGLANRTYALLPRTACSALSRGDTRMP
jgi:formylglycine-generating enzyme